MLSRVAENLFWMSRYMERTTSQLKLLRTLYFATQEGNHFLKTEMITKAFCNGHFDVSTEQPIDAFLNCLLFDKNNENSIISNVFKARENARSVQDHITLEVWQTLNEFYLLIKMQSNSEVIERDDPITIFDRLIDKCMHYFGVVGCAMFRGEGYYFINLGKNYERIIQTSQLLRTQLIQNNGLEDKVESQLSWRFFLYAMSGYEFYLKSHSGSISPEKIIQQIMYDELFPNSITHCMNQIEFYGNHLSKGRKNEIIKEVNFSIGKMSAFIKYHELDYNITSFNEYFERLQVHLHAVLNALNKNYFGIS
jgi:uncharacterized alpha-E superfamily protein